MVIYITFELGTNKAIQFVTFLSWGQTNNTICVKLEHNADHVLITVDDDGPGIKSEHRDDVFKAFFRLDPSRNTSTGGTGLGLTIARDIVQSHGGDLHLNQAPIGGLRAIIRLPL